MTQLQTPLISAVTNRHLFADHDEAACEQLVEWAGAVADAGVDLLQVRERELTDARLVRLVRDVVAATSGRPVRVLVNERTDVALVAGAAGVHLPANAPPAETIRRITPPGFVIGRSIHAGDDVAALDGEGGYDYLTFGSVFATSSKPANHRPAGVDALRRAAAATTLPVLAIGGIAVNRAPEVARAGAGGVAAIGLFVEPWRDTLKTRAARLASLVGALRDALAAARDA